MTKKITYLLGAGASANAVPMVNSMYRGMKEISLRLDLNKIALPEIKDSIGKHQTFCKELSEQLTIMANKHIEFGTIDTYAKYLYLSRQNEELDNLKKFLSYFFILHQSYFYDVIPIIQQDQKFAYLDKRYLTFIVSLMEKDKFHNNVKILSWNYDYQFIRALKYFKNEKNGIYPLLGIPEGLYYENANIQLYHLNGIAGLTETANRINEITFFDYFENLENKDDIFGSLENFFNDKNNFFKFAWENELIFNSDADHNKSNVNNVSHVMKGIMDHLNESEIMVVIGYSFPFFNRKIDNQFFQYFSENATPENKKRIYYQNVHDKIEEKAKNLYQQFNLKPEFIDIFPYDDITNFFIPYEY